MMNRRGLVFGMLSAGMAARASAGAMPDSLAALAGARGNRFGSTLGLGDFEDAG